MKSYSNEWTDLTYNSMSPTLAQDVLNRSMTYFDEIKVMIDQINQIKRNCDQLADYVNESLQNIVDYLNERIEDFNKSINKFFEDVNAALEKFKADQEQFKTDMLAAFEQFKQAMLERQQEFEDRIDQKIADLEGQWNDMKSEWETVKSEWESLKQEWASFKEEILQMIEDFKTEINNKFNDYTNKTDEDLEKWKDETFNYILGAIAALEQKLISMLPDIVLEKLPEAMSKLAGVCMEYDPETRTFNVLYDEHFARDPQNRLTWVGGSTGGDSIEPGQGIDMQDNPETSKKTVQVKLAADSGLGFDENGGLKQTGGPGGDTIVAGEGIKVEGDGTKTVSTTPATQTTLGGVKTGDPQVTGITVSEDGTISQTRWTPTDVTNDFEFFDSNLENVAPLWTLDGQYNPQGKQFMLYVRMSPDAIEQIGIPQQAQVIWNPDTQWTYDTTPTIQAVQTADLVSNSTFKVTLTLPQAQTNKCPRNGTGTIQFSWDGKVNVASLEFKLIKSDLTLDSETPILVDGTPIRSNDTVRFTQLGQKTVTFKLADGTVLQNLSGLGLTARAFASRMSIVTDYDNMSLEFAGSTVQLKTARVIDGPITFNMYKQDFGISNVDALDPVISFNIVYESDVWDAIKLVCQAPSNTIDNFTTNQVIQFLLPGYGGSSNDFKLESSDGEVVGLGGLGVQSVNIQAGGQVTLFAGRFGSVTLTLTTRQYTTQLSKTIDITVSETDNVPHIKLTTNQTSVGDQALDIANPKEVQIRDISKAQGSVMFWAQSYPSKDYIYPPEVNVTVKLNNQQVWTSQIRKDTDLNNTQFSVDLSSHSAGELFMIEYGNTRFEQPVSITFGRVVD